MMLDTKRKENLIVIKILQDVYWFFVQQSIFGGYVGLKASAF